MGGLQRWARENRWAAGGIALAVVALAVVVGVLVSGGEEASRLADPAAAGREAPEATSDPGTGSEPGATSSPGAAGAGAGGGETEPSASDDGGGPGGGGKTQAAAAACRPRSVQGTGITARQVTIGQIVTDSSQLPQQFGPALGGLRAWVERTNRAGGICGRTIKLESTNDQGNPATHGADFRSLAGRVFAFVGNESLFDGLEYQQRPPFAPTVTDGGQPVPDVGGLAFSYNRSQSSWHAGVIGSISPVLVGGGQFKFFQDDARRNGGACRKAGVVYLREPTGASEDQARLGDVALRRSWGANLGDGNTQLYAANLLDPEQAYQVMVQRMVADGMNCVFAYTDLSSSVNLVKAMVAQGVWPPASCRRGAACFRVTYIPLSAFDPKFVRDAGAASTAVSTFIPHLPFNETSNPAMRRYGDALKRVPGARPSTFSALGYASGEMFGDALLACGGAPTRTCLMNQVRGLRSFEASGLLGGTTPFRRTKVSYSNYGAFGWKWIFNCSVAVRVGQRGGVRDFYRVNPGSGFFCDSLKVARGSPA